MFSVSSAQPSTSTHIYEVPGDVPEIPGTTEAHLCILDAFRTAIAQRIVNVFPELVLEKVSDVGSESFASLISLAGV